jgi:bla regulator protein BlaR1
MLLRMSISGGILIIFIILLRTFYMNRLPKRAFVLFWCIVLLRLLAPVHLPLQYGITLPVTNLADKHFDQTYSADLSISRLSANELMNASSATNLYSVNWFQIVWLSGVIIFALVLGFLYIKEYRKIRESLPLCVNKEKEMKLLAAIPTYIQLLVSDKIFSPLTFGVFRPKIILPKHFGSLNHYKLKCVLTHELIHVNRADNLLKIIMLIALCMHWFNPLVWIMYIFLNRDIELSCDEKVISLLGENMIKEYALTLFTLAEKQSNRTLFSNGFGKSSIQERMTAMLKFKKTTVLSIICTIFLFGAALTVFAEDAAKTNRISYDTAEYIDGYDESAGSVGVVARFPQFSEYKKYGLTYDSQHDHLLYKKKVVGYFKDEFSEGKYLRVQDNSGVIGIVVDRDSDDKIKGLTTVEIPDDTDVISTENGVAISESAQHITTENSVEMETASSTAYEKGADNNSQVLKKYQSIGISYSTSKNLWLYNRKEIAGLIDQDSIYMDENAGKNKVYLKVNRGLTKIHLKEISETTFNKLVDTSN